jgi:hypothetical protein
MRKKKQMERYTIDGWKETTNRNSAELTGRQATRSYDFCSPITRVQRFCPVFNLYGDFLQVGKDWKAR